MNDYWSRKNPHEEMKNGKTREENREATQDPEFGWLRIRRRSKLEDIQKYAAALKRAATKEW